MKYLRLGTFVLLFVFMGVLVSQFFATQSLAAALTSSKDTISDSRAGVAAVHTFKFTTPSATNIKTIDFQFCTTASSGCTAPPGMIITASPTLGTVTGIGGSSYSATGTSATCTGTGNTACTATLTVGTPAAQSNVEVTVPFNVGITNPTTASSSAFVRIMTKDAGAAEIDRTTVAFAVLTSTSIALSASVDPNLTFIVTGVNSGGAVNTDTTNITTTANTIPFATLSAGMTSVGAHDVTVTTNASGGYTVTVAALADPPMSDGSKNIDYFTGTNATPTAWSSPAGGSPSVNTGFVGYTTEDSSLGTGTPARFTTGPPKWAGLITTAEEVIYSANGVAYQTTRVGWKAEVNGLQPQGSYSGTAILVATPTY